MDRNQHSSHHSKSSHASRRSYSPNRNRYRDDSRSHSPGSSGNRRRNYNDYSERRSSDERYRNKRYCDDSSRQYRRASDDDVQPKRYSSGYKNDDNHKYEQRMNMNRNVVADEKPAISPPPSAVAAVEEQQEYIDYSITIPPQNYLVDNQYPTTSHADTLWQNDAKSPDDKIAVLERKLAEERKLLMEKEEKRIAIERKLAEEKRSEKQLATSEKQVKLDEKKKIASEKKVLLPYEVLYEKSPAKTFANDSEESSEKQKAVEKVKEEQKRIDEQYKLLEKRILDDKKAFLEKKIAEDKKSLIEKKTLLEKKFKNDEMNSDLQLQKKLINQYQQSNAMLSHNINALIMLNQLNPLYNQPQQTVVATTGLSSNVVQPLSFDVNTLTSKASPKLHKQDSPRIEKPVLKAFTAVSKNKKANSLTSLNAEEIMLLKNLLNKKNSMTSPDPSVTSNHSSASSGLKIHSSPKKSSKPIPFNAAGSTNNSNVNKPMKAKAVPHSVAKYIDQAVHTNSPKRTSLLNSPNRLMPLPDLKAASPLKSTMITKSDDIILNKMNRKPADIMLNKLNKKSDEFILNKMNKKSDDFILNSVNKKFDDVSCSTNRQSNTSTKPSRPSSFRNDASVFLKSNYANLNTSQSSSQSKLFDQLKVTSEPNTPKTGSKLSFSEYRKRKQEGGSLPPSPIVKQPSQELPFDTSLTTDTLKTTQNHLSSDSDKKEQKESSFDIENEYEAFMKAIESNDDIQTHTKVSKTSNDLQNKINDSSTKNSTTSSSKITKRTSSERKADILKPFIRKDVSPVKASHVNPVKASHVNPVKASHVNPVKASHVNPVKASHVNPVKASHVNPVKASHLKEEVKSAEVTNSEHVQSKHRASNVANVVTENNKFKPNSQPLNITAPRVTTAQPPNILSNKQSTNVLAISPSNDVREKLLKHEKQTSKINKKMTDSKKSAAVDSCKVMNIAQQKNKDDSKNQSLNIVKDEKKTVLMLNSKKTMNKDSSKVKQEEVSKSEKYLREKVKIITARISELSGSKEKKPKKKNDIQMAHREENASKKHRKLSIPSANESKKESEIPKDIQNNVKNESIKLEPDGVSEIVIPSSVSQTSQSSIISELDLPSSEATADPAELKVKISMYNDTGEVIGKRKSKATLKKQAFLEELQKSKKRQRKKSADEGTPKNTKKLKNSISETPPNTKVDKKYEVENIIQNKRKRSKSETNEISSESDASYSTPKTKAEMKFYALKEQEKSKLSKTPAKKGLKSENEIPPSAELLQKKEKEVEDETKQKEHAKQPKSSKKQSPSKINEKKGNVAASSTVNTEDLTFNSMVKFVLNTPAKQKKYKCKTCEAEFWKEQELTRHSLIHKLKTYDCYKCENKFTTMRALTKHLLIHDEAPRIISSTRPHDCDRCGEKFETENQLLVHLEIHNMKELDHVCAFCSAKYHSLAELYTHIQQRHPEGMQQVLRCSQCNTCLKNLGEFRSHLLKEHHMNNKEATLACRNKGVIPEEYRLYEEERKQILENKKRAKGLLLRSGNTVAKKPKITTSKQLKHKNSGLQKAKEVILKSKQVQRTIRNVSRSSERIKHLSRKAGDDLVVDTTVVANNENILPVASNSVEQVVISKLSEQSSSIKTLASHDTDTNHVTPAVNEIISSPSLLIRQCTDTSPVKTVSANKPLISVNKPVISIKPKLAVKQPIKTVVPVKQSNPVQQSNPVINEAMIKLKKHLVAETVQFKPKSNISANKSKIKILGARNLKKQIKIKISNNKRLVILPHKKAIHPQLQAIESIIKLNKDDDKTTALPVSALEDIFNRVKNVDGISSNQQAPGPSPVQTIRRVAKPKLTLQLTNKNKTETTPVRTNVIAPDSDKIRIDDEEKRMKLQFESAERTARMLIRNQRRKDDGTIEKKTNSDNGNAQKKSKRRTSSSSLTSPREGVTPTKVEPIKVKVHIKMSDYVTESTAILPSPIKIDDIPNKPVTEIKTIKSSKNKRKNKVRKNETETVSKPDSVNNVKRKRKKYYVYEHELLANESRLEPRILLDQIASSSKLLDSVNAVPYDDTPVEDNNAYLNNFGYDNDYDYSAKADDVFLTEADLLSSLMTLADASLNEDVKRQMEESCRRVLVQDVTSTLDVVLDQVENEIDGFITPKIIEKLVDSILPEDLQSVPTPSSLCPEYVATTSPLLPNSIPMPILFDFKSVPTPIPLDRKPVTTPRPLVKTQSTADIDVLASVLDNLIDKVETMKEQPSQESTILLPHSKNVLVEFCDIVCERELNESNDESCSSEVKHVLNEICDNVINSNDSFENVLNEFCDLVCKKEMLTSTVQRGQQLTNDRKLSTFTGPQLFSSDTVNNPRNNDIPVINDIISAINNSVISSITDTNTPINNVIIDTVGEFETNENFEIISDIISNMLDRVCSNVSHATKCDIIADNIIKDDLITDDVVKYDVITDNIVRDDVVKDDVMNNKCNDVTYINNSADTANSTDSLIIEHLVNDLLSLVCETAMSETTTTILEQQEENVEPKVISRDSVKDGPTIISRPKLSKVIDLDLTDIPSIKTFSQTAKNFNRNKINSTFIDETFNINDVFIKTEPPDYYENYDVTLEYDPDITTVDSKAWFQNVNNRISKRALKTYPCDRDVFEICENRVDSFHPLRSDKTSHPSQIDPFKCLYCRECFIKQSSYAEHACFSKYTETSQGTNKYRPINNRCCNCNISFTLKNHLNIHQKMHRGEIACTYCKRNLTNKLAFQNHIYRKHEINETFKCKVCSQTFKSRLSMVAHTCIKNIECSFCALPFSNKKTLKRHELFVHSRVDRPNKCVVCAQSFMRPSYLRIHMKSHVGILPFHCIYCGKLFRQQKLLHQHILRCKELKC